MQKSMETSNNPKDEYLYVPCTCPCHSNKGVVHITACCHDGYRKIKKTSIVKEEHIEKLLVSTKQITDEPINELNSLWRLIYEQRIRQYRTGTYDFWAVRRV